jgi:hypothetical protein
MTKQQREDARELRSAGYTAIAANYAATIRAHDALRRDVRRAIELRNVPTCAHDIAEKGEIWKRFERMVKR